MMNTKSIIIDNFYPDPDYVRNIAINCEYNLTGSNINWAGSATKKSYQMPNLESYVSQKAGIPLKIQDIRLNGFFRKSFANDSVKCTAHVDTPLDNRIKIVGKDKIYYTGILYLALPEFCKNKAGTCFFKHIKSGKEKVESNKDLQLLLDGFNKQSWELTETVEMIYNRLLLLNADYFHNPGDSFGDNDINCVYKQIFCFYTDIDN